VHLVWKRCHSWGNVIGEHHVDPEAATQIALAANSAAGSGAPPHLAALTRETYCPAPYDQFVIQWNGDVVSCCTDYEGRTKTANVFASSIEEVWKSETVRQRKQDMLEGRLLDVCASCQGLK
jgi:radical SAM protein with 4Fe4S-binding SPASM domain